jgi:hypothetical protein
MTEYLEGTDKNVVVSRQQNKYKKEKLIGKNCA